MENNKDKLIDYDSEVFENNDKKKITNKQHSEAIRKANNLKGTKHKKPPWLKF